MCCALPRTTATSSRYGMSANLTQARGMVVETPGDVWASGVPTVW